MKYNKNHYIQGTEYSEDELRSVPVGSVIWLYWAKDGDPERVRFDGPHKIVGIEGDSFYVSDDENYSPNPNDDRPFYGMEDWEYNGETGRGQARYYRTTPNNNNQ